MKQMSRKAFMLMLKDDSGEISPIRLDVGQVTSDNALIVLDEYNDTCWVWIGRHVNMPTRMHALRMARGIQKSGFKIGVTTIGLAASKIVEMMEKDDTDPDIASAIVSFKGILDTKWSFDDKVLAFKGDAGVGASSEPIAGAPKKKLLPEPETTLKAETVYEEPARHAAPPPKPPTPPPTPKKLITLADKKVAYLMLAISNNSDIFYTEKFERGGDTGLKIEVPGVMVLEAIMRGTQLSISPGDFGGSEEALKIKTDFTEMVKDL
ncbi:hypothetical protein EU528_12260 [Candidatus Thorarchaeota archaeon]|nr:MAG: hypothetical protein EU528_12260 [Candidatus Thorarchaeota archaeon]